MTSGPEAVSGLVVVDKPKGLTSHQVVSRVRRLAGTRKVGHGGTLDPMATGVLLVGVERATRLLGFLAEGRKTYQATVRLGQATVTDDAEGEVTASTGAAGITPEQVAAALPGYVGSIRQRPSAVSAIKVGGVRSYTRVRAGEDVELAERPVTVHRYDLLEVREAAADGRVAVLDCEVEVECSAGTYIRALARDLGAELGVGGHLTRLRRTAVAPFTEDEAQSLDDQHRELTLIELPALVRRVFPTLEVTEAEAVDVTFGRRLQRPVPAEVTALLSADNQFLALYRPDGDGSRAISVFVGGRSG